MHVNLFTYATQAVLYAIAFVLTFFQSSEGEPVTPQSCRLTLAFDVCYWTLWMALFSRTFMTSYMNVKFSRSLEECNRNFHLVFNEDMNVV